ncbi:GatB/YqeY domain-containing protein [Reinekea thalattae]|uniref:GatB/YqeY domain-containing protein n=1 Tax=Reinekea thalattae TaxID=2593301 RepID=A0A5C8ZAH5_9GAMM|nr:GatB/YqeY domain-containing protein [Reinekea thalattae]TXR54181.1 GatB/YqeY domain-containing protein [Reinekea thalattae]
MSELKQLLTQNMKEAMRAKEKQRLGTIRMILAELKRIEVDERIELDDTRVLAVLDKMTKQRRDSLAQYEEAGREDLAAIERYELEVISTFLPAALTEAEIEALVAEAIAQAEAKSMADMGKVMGIIKPKAQGRADMADISKLIKAQLN